MTFLGFTNFNEWCLKRDSEDYIESYIEYKALTENITLKEAANRSLARLQTLATSKAIVIITAFRGENTLTHNRGLNVLLKKDIRQLGWGYTPVSGGFVEESANGQKTHVREESFFVSPTGNEKEITNNVINLITKYKQDAALVKFPEIENAYLVSTSGEKTNVGKWHADPQLMAQYYTRMRKGPSNRQFTFEAVGDDSLYTRMVVDNFFKNLIRT